MLIAESPERFLDHIGFNEDLLDCFLPSLLRMSNLRFGFCDSVKLFPLNFGPHVIDGNDSTCRNYFLANGYTLFSFFFFYFFLFFLVAVGRLILKFCDGLNPYGSLVVH